MRKRNWTEDNLKKAVKNSKSVRQVLLKINLKAAGGNYAQIKKYIKEFGLDSSHFTGQGWNKGLIFPLKPAIPLKELLVRGSTYQSYKLKKRLFSEGVKLPKCEECGWNKVSVDGRTPVELDHINGDNMDNRLCNLRILCPNCHSLKLTHRGCNRKEGK
jgi:hypothetical protein